MKPTLKEKYTSDKCRAIRTLFAKDVHAWSKIRDERKLDVQCTSTEQGPWPDAEWKARHTKGSERPCLHEDVLTQNKNQVVNQIEMNPMGVEAQPAGSGADRETADALEGRIRHIEYETKAALAYLIAVGNAAAGSYGFWKMETVWRGKFKQGVCIEPVLDPDTITPGFSKKPDWSDMRRCWEHEWMSNEEFKERWPEAKLAGYDTIDDVDQAAKWSRDGQVMVCAYWHFEEDEREALRLDAGEGLGQFDAYLDEFPTGTLNDKAILDRRTVKRSKVVKTLFSGVEALEETEWIDPGDEDEGVKPEIPIMVVTGKVSYEAGQMVIDSLVRKGRVGQLLYDYCISQMQEMMALAPRTSRLGPEGTFDTSTNWNPRSITATKEYKLVHDPETSQLAPAPVLEQYDISGIQFLEVVKDSLLRGIQNAIGMTTAERKDRTAKSGKALDQLQQEMSVATAHYFGSLRVAQERGYRILQRILPLIDTDQEVGVRDKFGKHEMKPMAKAYGVRHTVTVGSGKLYQNLQDKQEETASELLALKDPMITLAVLPYAIQMKGLGREFTEPMVRMIESIQPPQMQQARNGDKNQMPPEALQAIQKAQQAAQALNQHAHELETKVIELEDERRAKVLELDTKERMAQDDNRTKIEIATINASVKENVAALQQQIASIKHIADALTQKFQLGHEANQADLDRQTQAQQADADRQHQQQLAGDQNQLTQQQIDAQREAASQPQA